MRNAILSLFLLLMLSDPVIGLEVRAVVDRTHIDPGDSLGLSVFISDGDGSVDVSLIEDFKVLSRGSGTSVKIINGNMTKEVTYNYALFPKKNGQLKIPPLKVSTDDGDMLTKEIIVNVSQTSADTNEDRDVFVRATISEESPYEGQQIIYTFKVFHGVQITNAQLIQEPGFEGFSAKKIGEDKSYKTVLSGRGYGVIERNYVLVPLKAGSLTIEPVILKCDLLKPGRSRGRSFDPFFDDPFFGRTNLETKTFATSAVTVIVKALPPYTFNIPFSGLVGNFEFEVQVDKKQMKVGDSVTLSLVVKGNGNIMDSEEPSVAIPDSFKMYKDNPEDDVHLDEGGYSGKKIFRMALVPVVPGQVDLGPIEYSFFNVEKDRYELFRTPIISMRVSPSEDKENMESFSSQPKELLSEFKKEQVQFIGRDILPLKEEMNAMENRKELPFSIFFLYWLAPFFCFTAVKLYFQFAGKQMDDRAVMGQRAQMALKKAYEKGLPREELLALLYTALVSKVLAQAGIKGETLTFVEVEKILNSKGHATETVQQTIHLLDRIESFRYGGGYSDGEDFSHLLSETKAIIRRLS